MDHEKLKKLDADTRKNLKEGTGPVHECICNLFYNPPEEQPNIIGSVKKALASMGSKKKKNTLAAFQTKKSSIKVGSTPVRMSHTKAETTPAKKGTTIKDGSGLVTSSLEEVKRTKSCGKCGCDKQKFILKHSYANIRITTPDVSNICPCPTDCMPGKEKLKNNLEVTIERAAVTSGPFAQTSQGDADQTDESDKE